MDQRTPFTDADREELCRLAASMLCGDISDVEAERLERLVVDNPKACRFYMEFICDACNIRSLTAPGHFGARAFIGGKIDDNALLPEVVMPPGHFHDAAGHFTEAVFDQDFPFVHGSGKRPAASVPGESDHRSEISGSILPASDAEPISYDLASISRKPLTDGSYSAWVFAYTIATVVLCAMVLGAWALKIVPHNDTAGKSIASTPSDPQPEMVFVGRITGMADVKWCDDPLYLPTMSFAGVPLGRRYKLDAGLVEITYYSGAKIVLEGPCEFEADSTTGGFLKVGKLAARVETKVEGGRRKADHSPLFPRPSSLFSVRTPTAIVTDLGTEFGVKVDKEGHTATVVFRGTVRMDLAGGNAGKEGGSVTLHEYESAQTYKSSNSDDLLALRGGSLDPKEFVRRIAQLPKALDLLDIVAGGNGTWQHRECGIDPTTGMEDRLFLSQYREAGSGFRPWYRNISWHKLIDGVFVPDGRMGKVRINSAGSRFAGFPKTDGKASGSIWARAATVERAGREAKREQWIYALESAEQYMPGNRGLLGLHANAGITFDLGAMRVAYRGARPARFRATVAMADANGIVADESNIEQSADAWVLVDNRLKWHRLHLSPRDGVLTVEIELGPKNRFLTLASTDGGNGSLNDWIVFGDPTIEMIPIKEGAKRDGLGVSEEIGR